MIETRNSTFARGLLLVCGLALVLVLFTPIWRIDLTAPQYPEGLFLHIYANKLAGNVDIINGLNHYIGMKTLHTDDFLEFKVLPWIIIFFSVFFIIAAILARRKLTNILFILFVSFGVLAMVDFWRWEYDYGHNLDPDAAIIVPGMAYQPPLIGFKQLLNFGAYSVPDIGGWIFISVGAILLFVVVREWKAKTHAKKHHVAAAASLILLLSACTTEPPTIRLGKDHCASCEMTISDKRFGGAIVTTKGKAYTFDDPRCIIAFMRDGKVKTENISQTLFVNFNEPHNLIAPESAFFLQSPKLKSPMNGNIAAFADEDSREKTFQSFYGNFISWEEMQK